RLGIHDKLLAAGFIQKFGGEMADAGGEKAVKFYFCDGFKSRTDRSYQVTRSEFDKLLLDHSREQGAEVCEATNVETVEFDNQGVHLGVTEHGTGERLLRAKYLIDSSGRNSFLGNRYNLKKNYTHLKKISLFAHYEGVQWESGRDGTLTRMVRVLDSWWWIIPLHNNRTSV